MNFLLFTYIIVSAQNVSSFIFPAQTVTDNSRLESRSEVSIPTFMPSCYLRIVGVNDYDFLVIILKFKMAASR